MTQPSMWWIPLAVPERPGERCPCGCELKRPIEWAVGICDGCRIGAHIKPQNRRCVPDFVDEELPFFENDETTAGQSALPAKGD